MAESQPFQPSRRVAYLECQKRGHTPSGRVLTSNPPWEVCKFCGTHYGSADVTVPPTSGKRWIPLWRRW